MSESTIDSNRTSGGQKSYIWSTQIFPLDSNHTEGLTLIIMNKLNYNIEHKKLDYCHILVVRVLPN